MPGAGPCLNSSRAWQTAASAEEYGGMTLPMGARRVVAGARAPLGASPTAAQCMPANGAKISPTGSGHIYRGGMQPKLASAAGRCATVHGWRCPARRRGLSSPLYAALQASATGRRASIRLSRLAMPTGIAMRPVRSNFARSAAWLFCRKERQHDEVCTRHAFRRTVAGGQPHSVSAMGARRARCRSRTQGGRRLPSFTHASHPRRMVHGDG